MSSERPHFKFREPVNRWAYLGLFAAVILPMSWGIWGIIPYVGELVTGCERASPILCRNDNFLGGQGFITVPIYLTFIFGTLLAGLRGFSKVKKNIHLIKDESAFRLTGMKSATFAHLVCVIIYFVGLFVLFVIPENPALDTQSFTEEMGVLGILLFIGLIVNFFLWITVTLTLGMLCALIFKAVAVKKISTSDIKSRTESPTEQA